METKKLIYKIKNFIFSVLCFFRYEIDKKKYKMPIVQSIEDTIFQFIKDNNSSGRFGDGELAIILGKDIRFQNADPNLAQRLKEILQLNEKIDHFIVCIPDIFQGLDYCKKEARKYHFEQLIRNYKIWYQNINPRRIYYNAFSSRFYSLYKNKEKCDAIIELWKKVWDNKKILIVEGEFSRIGVGNSLFENATQIERILCPAKNAWSVYDDILMKTLELCDKCDLVLVGLGPTATVLCYDLYEKGVKALDVGHIDIELEWFRRGVSRRVAIEGKAVNEVEDTNYLEFELNNQEYYNQIVARIN